MEKLDWFDCARELKRLNGDGLSSTEYLELEQEEFPSPFRLPTNIAIQPLEIPGVYRVQEEYMGASALVYFMDGVQRTVLWKYYDFNGFRIPLFLHFSGAVIMHRRRPDEFVPLKSLFRSRVLVPRFLYEAWEDVDGLEDTGAERCWDLNEIRGKAMVKSRGLRQEIEQELMRRFLAEQIEDALLVKDGNIFGSMGSARVVGLIKTHSTVYLQEAHPAVQRFIWDMPEYHRSMVFSIRLIENGSPGHRVNSFYLRIYDPKYPEMGLLRVEYNGGISVDEFSSWLIAEKCVRASCSRWDRQIYPIQRCEDYLRTQIPSSQRLKASLRAL